MSFYIGAREIIFLKNSNGIEMDTKIFGKYNNEPALELLVPKIADVSAGDYTAETFALANEKNPAQRPFYICHHTAVTLTVLPWFSEDEIQLTIPAGPWPMPMRKISNDVGNSATSIQIAY